MLNRLEGNSLQTAFQSALAESLIRREDTAVIFHDLGMLKQRVNAVQAAFPDQALHAAAVKALPLRRVLKHLRDWGMGFEVASLAELHLALQTGVPPSKIVFDSPAKTEEEIQFALESGVYLNADSFSELARIAQLRKRIHSPISRIGLRINPQIGGGRIAITGVASEYSKFGVPLDRSTEIVASFQEHRWLTGLHFHIGSQGMSLSQFIESARRMMNLRRFIHEATGRHQIDCIDLGGGIPVPYLEGDVAADVGEYATELRASLPELFAPDVVLITEFGRMLHANAGWVASRVEYVKEQSGYQTLVTHFGADLCLRECYDSAHWRHEWFVFDPAGSWKTGDSELYQVAGPLCFAGDFPGRNLSLPQVNPGDYLILRDAGAYTLSMWSRYNSRQAPRVLGYQQEGHQGFRWEILKERESVEEVLQFWE